MSLWSRIQDALAALATGEGLSVVFDRLRTPPERSVAFTIAVIALSAKMAKADGQVTRDEVAAFRQVFHIPPAEERAAARVFNLAREDVAGFEDYARRIARMFQGRGRDGVLPDLLGGLFHIATADGAYHPAEDAFLSRVARIFDLSEAEFWRIRAAHVAGAAPDPYTVLGVTPATPLEDIRTAWRAAVRATHPDRMMARGVPEEAMKLAERRLIAINRAWEEISERTQPGRTG
jgi:DnaJ like chaperone protein